VAGCAKQLRACLARNLILIPSPEERFLPLMGDLDNLVALQDSQKALVRWAPPAGEARRVPG
jgi:hypothetical protein